jgi:hypothetical protein
LFAGSSEADEPVKSAVVLGTPTQDSRHKPTLLAMELTRCCCMPAVLVCAGSSEADELVKIAAVLGTPTQDDWAEGLRLATAMDFR